MLEILGNKNSIKNPAALDGDSFDFFHFREKVAMHLELLQHARLCHIYLEIIPLHATFLKDVESTKAFL